MWDSFLVSYDYNYCFYSEWVYILVHILWSENLALYVVSKIISWKYFDPVPRLRWNI